MTAANKAKEMVAQMWVNPVMHFNDCKQCALKSVEQIIKAVPAFVGEFPKKEYWYEVKKEIEKL